MKKKTRSRKTVTLDKLLWKNLKIKSVKHDIFFENVLDEAVSEYIKMRSPIK